MPVLSIMVLSQSPRNFCNCIDVSLSASALPATKGFISVTNEERIHSMPSLVMLCLAQPIKKGLHLVRRERPSVRPRNGQVRPHRNATVAGGTY